MLFIYKAGLTRPKTILFVYKIGLTGP